MTRNRRDILKVLKTEIQVSATPKRVWAILTDFEKFSKWNPFIKNIEGEVKAGERLTVRIPPPNSKEMVFKPVVKSAFANKAFNWAGHFLFPGVFDGEHTFKIEPNETGSLLIQKENFRRLFVPLFWGNLKKKHPFGF